MKYARIADGIVAEIIPTEATIPNVATWYGEEFASRCVEAADDIGEGMFYNWITKTFSETPPTPEPTTEEQIAALKAQLSTSDYKVIKCAECSLAELPAPYDIVALNVERQAIRDEINALEATL